MKLVSSRIAHPRIYSGPEAKRRSAGPEQSRRLTERLGICLRRSLVFRDESTRNMAQLLVAFLVALAVVVGIGWLFFGGAL